MKNKITFKNKWFRLVLGCIILSAFSSPIIYSQTKVESETIFQQANDAFRNAKYDEAKMLYLNVVQRGVVSEKLYFNLGNTFFKLKDYTHAVLYFEKAALLDPSDEDIRYNLSLVRGLVGDKTEEVHRLFLVTWLVAFSELNSSDQWAWWALVSFLLFTLSAIFFLLIANMNLKKLGLIISFFFLMFFISSLASSYYRYSLLRNSRQAIVGQATVHVKSSPSDDGTDIFIVHEGTKVQMLDSVGLWKEIRIPDGNRGWVFKETLLPI